MAGHFRNGSNENHEIPVNHLEIVHHRNSSKEIKYSKPVWFLKLLYPLPCHLVVPILAEFTCTQINHMCIRNLINSLPLKLINATIPSRKLNHSCLLHNGLFQHLLHHSYCCFLFSSFLLGHWVYCWWWERMESWLWLPKLGSWKGISFGW